MQPSQTKKRSKLPILAGCGALLALSCCGFIAFAGWRGGIDADELDPLADACDGAAVDGAGAYPHPDPRFIVFVRDGNRWDRTSLGTLPLDQRSDTNLVVCLEPEQEIEDSECSFMTLTEIRRFRRTHYVARARVVAPATGSVLYAGEINSGTPECITGQFVSDDDDAYEGESVDRADVERWVASWRATQSGG